MKGEFLSDRGRVRPHNEDSGGIYYNKANQLLAIIADGMGGHQAGDVASLMATEYLEMKWQETNEFQTPDAAQVWLSAILSEINEIIYKRSLEQEECQGMGTTVVITICTTEFIIIGHVGDSRCYLLNDHSFKSLTSDHSLVNELLRLGEITQADAEHHPRKNVVLKALGTEASVSPDIKALEWEKGNLILLCSDGLTDKVLDKELAENLEKEKPILEIGQDLVDLANERGGDDNISLIIVTHTDSFKAGDKPC